MRRVVVTGLGLITPLGCGVKTTWEKLIMAKSGISKIARFDASTLPCQVAGQVTVGTAPGEFNSDDYFSSKDKRKMDYFMQYGVAAASQAIDDSGWKPKLEEEKDRTGIMIGSGIGGLPEIENSTIKLYEQKRVSPFFIPSSLINLVSGNISIKYGFTGPNHAVVTACSSGAHAIGDAARIIACDDADVMVAGGTEGAVCKIGVSGFAAAKALSTSYNDTPEQASRPWDKKRDGFVMGEGSGIVVLEEYEHAKKRGAHIYGEIIGYGLTGDAYHITATNGIGGYKSMLMAMRKAGLNPDQLDYINAHGTSTPLGDDIELGSVEKMLGSAASGVCMSSTKSSIGHLLGAAGGVEAIFSILAINNNIVPPTLNLHSASKTTDIDLIPNEAKEKKVDIAMSNSFGFGGTNSTLIFKKV